MPVITAVIAMTSFVVSFSFRYVIPKIVVITGTAETIGAAIATGILVIAMLYAMNPETLKIPISANVGIKLFDLEIRGFFSVKASGAQKIVDIALIVHVIVNGLNVAAGIFSSAKNNPKLIIDMIA